MSSCPLFSCLMRVVVAGFFALSAWNTINDLNTHSEALPGRYKTFQTRVESMSGYKFHSHIHHDKVSEFAEQIVMYVAYATLGLSGLALLVPCAGKLSAFLWLLNQLLEHEFLELTQNRNMKQIEVLAMTLAVFCSALLVFSGSGSYKKCCPKKTAPKKTKTK